VIGATEAVVSPEHLMLSRGLQKLAFKQTQITVDAIRAPVVRLVLQRRAMAPRAPWPSGPALFTHFTLRCLLLPRLQGVKKPYNPIIGETFACYWKHADGSRSQYFAEQVLHRPPVSAIYFENRQNNVVATAHVWTKSQFSAPQTVKSILEGACYLNFLEHGEVRLPYPRRSASGAGSCFRRRSDS
jgi:hypothetical protein